jgi:hypothetical protein
MAQRTLKRLVSMRALVRLDRPPGGYGGGSQGHVFALDVAGQRLARGLHVRTVRRPWPVSSLFLRHGLDVTEWYVRLREAERTGAVELLEFVAEPYSWREFVTGHGSRAILKPDAFVRLAREGWEEQWFLEIDRATEHTPALRRQLDQYVAYWHSGVEQQRSDGLFPQVLWIVPNEKRHGELIDVIGRLSTEVWPLFQIATKSSAISILTVGVPP